MRVLKVAFCLALIPPVGGCSQAQNNAPAQAQPNKAQGVPEVTQVALEGKTLIDTQFGTPGIKLREIKSEKVNGQLGEPWQDESAWAPLRVNYQSRSEGNVTFQRAIISKLESGRWQIVHDLPQLSPDAMYVLEMTVRGAPETAGAPQSPLTVGVRHRDAPYEFLWQDQTVLSRDWQNLSFTFSPQNKDGKVGFYISSDNNGTVDIARVNLIATTKEAYIKLLEAKYPGGGPPNLLAQSRFPFGLPSGWSLGSHWGDDRDDVAEPTAVSDKAVTGPSGAPALHVEGQRAFIVTSAPFAVVLPHRKHVASVYLRGKANGSWGVFVGDKEVAKQNLNLNSNTWQRVELPFSPDLAAKSHSLRFQSESGFDVWMDSVQVEAGEKASDFSSQMAAEVALSSGSLTGVQFSDQAAVVEYSVSGNATNATLKSRVVNIYGQEIAPAPVKLTAKSGRINYALFPQRPLGTYRVEAWLEDAAGKRISPYSEVIVNRLRRPHYWMKDAPKSPFGIHTLSTTRDIQMAKAMGINWARLHDAGGPYIGWHYLEPEKGKWAFRDSKIQRYRKNGMKLLAGLSTAPLWARINKTTHDGYADMWGEPANLADYANYVKTVTTRYKGVIDAYEIWNEPWLSKMFWHASYDGTYKASADPQARYARLMQAGYKAAKAVDPKLTIVGINSTTHEKEAGIIDGAEWTRGVIEHSGLQACDVISYHHYMGEYSAFPGDPVEKGYQHGLGPLLTKDGQAPKPVWMTEGSSLYGVNKAQGFYHHTLVGAGVEDNTVVADKLSRYQVALLAKGVDKVFLYSMSAAGSIWAALVNFDGSMHPSGAAHSNLAWQLEDTKFVKRAQLAPNVFAYVFSGKGRSVAVVAPKDGGSYSVPTSASLSASDLWGNKLSAGAKLPSTLSYISSTGTADSLLKTLQR